MIDWSARYGYLFLPLLGGALAVGLCNWFGWGRALAAPIDGGRSWRGRRIFGDHKTWRGVVAFAVGTAPVFWLQAAWLHEHPRLRALELFDYGAIPAPWAVGLALGAVSLLSELPNSFAKRRLGIAPGQAGRRGIGALFYFLDQIDLLLGFWLVLAWIVPLETGIVAGSVLFFALAHQGVTLAGHLLEMRSRAGPRAWRRVLRWR